MGKTRHRWIAMIDIDEYIFVKGSTCPSLPAILPSFNSFPALGLNWVFFGSSGHNTRPAAGNLASYSKCLPRKHKACEHVKSIVNTKYVEGLAWSPHHFTYANGAKAVNENKVPFDGPFSKPASHNRLMLHHYFSRSREEFELKSRRGGADGRASKNMGDFGHYNAAATENCTDGLRFWPRCCGGSNLTEDTRWLCSGVARFALQAASGGAGAGGAGSATAGAVKPAMLRL
ncbi:hypothetical protein HYH03_012745 [Edaphochlamys debaryana]|uniref:Glycosyltransferase family 92 protein n=1 Tax=Edaphochlamys debaryana TaxID=47281 RepID=A0A835XPK5_9CHLO|nr:hypothetical protein HYH03_012745 [Edaphochlamys debaryana]|eukprot:KAG2488747.1 hypothetical protein HYH03_012745 [Edaphochlamys debaryana]